MISRWWSLRIRYREGQQNSWGKWADWAQKTGKGTWNGGWYFKTGSADNGTKVEIILANRHKYSISAMCRKLGVPRSLVYYKKKGRKIDSKLENAVIEIFRKSRNNYGSRKIKIELAKRNITASKRRIRRIMDKYGLVSSYTIKQFKVHRTSCNEEKSRIRLTENLTTESSLKW